MIVMYVILDDLISFVVLDFVMFGVVFVCDGKGEFYRFYVLRSVESLMFIINVKF